jgi:DNA repair protein RadC
MTKITSPRDIFLLTKEIHKQSKELLIIFYLNKIGSILEKKTIQPKIKEIKFSHADIFSPTLQNKASFIILAHNHPSGNLFPSPSDKKTTKNLVNAGKILGITVIDHVIVSHQGYYSILQKSKASPPLAH